MRSKAVLVISLLAAVSAVVSISVHWAPISSANDASQKQPVIVELFTSEGCSSCPPADIFLKQLSDEQPLSGIEIIALEEHVDYWNHLGWSDPFSSNDFSRRQDEYSSLIPKSGVYTPQMIVDGRVQLIGSRADEVRDEIRTAAAAHPKARLLLSPAPSAKEHARAFALRLDPDSAPLSASSLDLYVAVTEKGLSSKVTAGENSGETLAHSPVVRQLRKLHSVHLPLADPVNFTIDLRDTWVPANLTVVAFLTDHHLQVQAAGSSQIQ
jgi:hypothetical protein